MNSPDRTGAAVRATAAQVLDGVLTQRHSLGQMLELPAAQTCEDPALLRELCFGTMRWLLPLQARLSRHLKQPIKQGQGEVTALLLLGIYQIDCLRIPDHAAVSATVEAARRLGRGWASKLINAVLRNHLRSGPPELLRDPAKTHPHWLKRTLKRDWGDASLTILEANDQRAPLWLRVNVTRSSPEAFEAALAQSGYKTARSVDVPNAVILLTSADIATLPGYNEGWFSVQDGAAQLAAPLLCPEEGHRILDACAAPGGKTTHCMELAPGAEVIAVDRDQRRLKIVAENLQRLQQSATLIAGDASRPDEWWDGSHFDSILLDAPCSATGIIRRHPDIKYLRTRANVADLVQLQTLLLDALWPALKPGGRLVYATCSVIRRENDEQIANFLKRTDSALSVPIDAEWGRPMSDGRQIMPGDGQMDGFYFAVLKKLD